MDKHAGERRAKRRILTVLTFSVAAIVASLLLGACQGTRAAQFTWDEWAMVAGVLLGMFALLVWAVNHDLNPPPPKPRRSVYRAPDGWLVFAMLALTAASPAQTVTLNNSSTLPWSGWARVNVDREPPANAGWLAAAGSQGVVTHVAEYRKGRRTGLDTWAVDVTCTLQPGETRTLDLASFTDAVAPVPPLPADLLGWFGGMPACNGTQLEFVGLPQIDGAGWSGHFRARVVGTRLLVCDLWLTWYPDQPWCHGEVQVTASNPNVPDLTETLSSTGVQLTFGDAFVSVLGGAWDGRVVPPGTKWGDGQARIVPVTLGWLRHLDQNAAGITPKGWMQVASFLGDEKWVVNGVGVQRLLADGNPALPVGFNAAAWANGLVGSTLARIHTWDVGTTGPNTRSGDTGAQTGDQVFVGGECIGAPSAVLIRYLGACKAANRPCHHREADGSPLSPTVHPNLRLWDGRAHWHTGVSPDQLGKPRALTLDEASGWWGPDVEHWFYNTTFAASRLTGSLALQDELRAQANIYLLQDTSAPGLSTSWWHAGRAVGWEHILVVHLWRGLEDRDLAARVRDRMFERWNRFTSTFAAVQWWDVRVDDPRLGTGEWISPWQDCVAAYGLDLAGRTFDVPAMRDAALAQAKHLLAVDLYQGDDGRWRSYSAVAVDGRVFVDNIFFLFGTPMAPAVVLRYEPNNARARAVWTQMKADAAQLFQTQWMPPGVQ